jgi:hypothetical protein
MTQANHLQYLKAEIKNVYIENLSMHRTINQLSVSTHHALLCSVVGMTSLRVLHVSNYTTVDVTTVSNANFYTEVTRSSSYFGV